MKLYFISTILLLSYGGSAQQWIDKKYSYDSTLNVTYGTAINFNGGIDSLKLDIYSPVCNDPSNQSRRPLLMWIHGGAFLAGGKDDLSITKLCREFAKRGYVTASISYRLGFIADDTAQNCNFPNYSCLHATDVAEWHRAYYRGVQDGKGALRYLINRNAQYRLDTSNIFLAGESAGAFIALGMALMDTSVERPTQTFQLADMAKPSNNSNSCVYNQGKVFASSTISRPDLGGIDGNIEPTTIRYTIKGVGNMYGAMMNDLLKFSKAKLAKPAIYSFHQPCDLVVPIDSGKVYGGLNWCLTNGYNCFKIKNTPLVYGSRAFSNWNKNNSYGYAIQDEFTITNFPFNFLFGSGSCADQINNPCHAYDNQNLRESNLAKFFAPLITTNPICDTTSRLSNETTYPVNIEINVYPNPVSNLLTVEFSNPLLNTLTLSNAQGQLLMQREIMGTKSVDLDMSRFTEGIYFLNLFTNSGLKEVRKIFKQ